MDLPIIFIGMDTIIMMEKLEMRIYQTMQIVELQVLCQFNNQRRCYGVYQNGKN